MTEQRTYLETHPWLTFGLDMQGAPPDFWIALGECHSKCEHLAGVALAPEVDKYLHRVYLAKGVAATTAIEGNTLSEQQVLQHLEGSLQVAPSQEYLKQEIDNILRGYNLVLDEISKGQLPPLSVERIKSLNAIVLIKLELADEETVPGQIRHHSVGVPGYRGAPAEDCEYLLARLCDWLNGPDFIPQPGQELMYAIVKATLAHLYLAWIHPFGDGNGRTARLIEVQILLASGAPSPACQLLSNHYNSTRAQYYKHLELARTDPRSFVRYAVNGLRDGLREQIETIRVQQWEIAWLNHVHKSCDELKGAKKARLKNLVLTLTSADSPTEFSKLRELSARVALDYRGFADRTLSRDLRILEKLDLIRRTDDGKWVANKRSILAFLPVRAKKESHRSKTP